MSNSIVIGGSGFIGRHVVRLLCESGRNVLVLGRRPAFDGELPKGGRYFQGNYGDRQFLRGILNDGCEVIDLAYSTVPKTSYEDPTFDILSNLPASVGLFQEALDSGVRRLVVVSSGGTVYGPPLELPIRENHPTSPVSPYGITKLTIDRYAMMYHRNAGLPAVVVRPANAYGEDQKSGTGQGFIAAAIGAILKGRDIEIYGVEGTIRDYIHVNDVAAGIVAALDHGEDGEIYNLGTGVGTSNAEIVRMLALHAGNRGMLAQSRTLPARRFDVEANILDSSKLKNISSWAPSVALNEGIERMWNAALKRHG